MAAEYAQFEFDDKEVQQFLSDANERLSQVVGGKKQYVSLLSAIVYADVDDHFVKESGPEGKWKSWADSYRKKMERINKQGNKILQFNGRLRQTFKPNHYRSSSQGLMWFNNAQTKSGYPYAAGHDEGDGKLPARPFMWLSDNAFEKIADQTLGFILEQGI